MESFLKIFGDYSISQVVQFTLAICFIITITSGALKRIFSQYDKSNTKQEMIENHDKDISILKKQISEICIKIDDLIKIIKETSIETKQYRCDNFHDKLFNMHQSFTKKGYVTMSDLDNWKSCLQEYESIGGNGAIHDKLNPEVLALPIKYINADK